MSRAAAARVSGYEVWDVTNVSAPTLVSSLRGLRNTHKPWWECTTGIAYLPGSRDVAAPNRWRVGQQMMIVDWKNPTSAPQYLRTLGLPGAEPDGTGPVPPTLHGAISANEHPNATGMLARGATENDAIGNRLYLAWGVGDNGVLQVLTGKNCFRPVRKDLDRRPRQTDERAIGRAADLGSCTCRTDQGGHTSFPVFGVKPKSYREGFTEYQDARHRAAGVGVDGRPLPGSAALELRRRRHGRKFEGRLRRAAAAARSRTRGRGRWSRRRCAVDPRAGEK